MAKTRLYLNTVQNRPGAVVAMHMASRAFGGEQPLLVVAGDTLFYPDFSFDGVIEAYHKFQAISPSASVVLMHTIDDEGTKKSGILEVNDDGLVRAFLEKPGPAATTSRVACPCFYILSPAAQQAIAEFLAVTPLEPLQARDAPGNFIRYLVSREPVYAVRISDRFDVGGLVSYVECEAFFAAVRE